MCQEKRLPATNVQPPSFLPSRFTIAAMRFVAVVSLDVIQERSKNWPFSLLLLLKERKAYKRAQSGPFPPSWSPHSPEHTGSYFYSRWFSTETTVQGKSRWYQVS
ncbi:hypothetical protein ACU8KH_00178 [Lachancea thermotolerans]